MIALFGGTFNPVHQGHIALAREVVKAFELKAVELLPSFIPVHRDTPKISASMRKHLVEIAIQPYPELILNTAEIDRQGPSYAIDTLHLLTEKFPGQAICWLMGADSFNSFSSWKQPDVILQMANLIVCTRPQVKLDQSTFPSNRLKQHEILSNFNSGKIAFYPMQPNNCSSTEIRKLLAQGETAEGCLAQPVLEFIRQNHLYETKVQSN